MTGHNENARPHEDINLDVPCCPSASTNGYLVPDQQDANASLGKVSLLSPSRKPHLLSQRDHSACAHVQNTPLKVRKTRENLRELELKPLPPLKGSAHNHARSSGGVSDTAYTADEQFASIPHWKDGGPGPVMPAWRMCDQPCVDTNQQHSRPGEPVQRHLSVGRSMFAKVRQGLSVRSRSSQTIRPVDSQASLARKWSGRRKTSVETDRQTQYYDALQETSECTAPSPSAGSSTENQSSVRTSDLLRSFPRPVCDIVADKRATDRGGNALFVPFIELAVAADASFVDAAKDQDVWVRIEASVKVEQVSTLQHGGTREGGPVGLDVIMLVDVCVGSDTAILLSQCFDALARELLKPGDRLVCFAIRNKQRHGARDAANFAATQIHGLQPIDVNLISSSVQQMISGKFPGWFEDGMDVHDLVLAAEAQGLRTSSSHVFVLAPAPSRLASRIGEVVHLPVHQIALGISEDKERFYRDHSQPAWMLHYAIDNVGELQKTLSNMSKQLHGGGVVRAIPTMRIRLKPARNCMVRDVVGHRSATDLRPGTRREIFMRLRVPVRCSRQGTSADLPDDVGGSGDGAEQESLFDELESLVGTLAVPILYVEARYSHTLLHAADPGTTVTSRTSFSLRRPRLDCRWSLGSLGADRGNTVTDRLYAQLAAFIAAQRPASEAIQLIKRYCTRPDHGVTKAVDDICALLARRTSSPSRQPSVTVTKPNSSDSDPSDHEGALLPNGTSESMTTAFSTGSSPSMSTTKGRFLQTPRCIATQPHHSRTQIHKRLPINVDLNAPDVPNVPGRGPSPVLTTPIPLSPLSTRTFLSPATWMIGPERSTRLKAATRGPYDPSRPDQNSGKLDREQPRPQLQLCNNGTKYHADGNQNTRDAARQIWHHIRQSSQSNRQTVFPGQVAGQDENLAPGEKMKGLGHPDPTAYTGYNNFKDEQNRPSDGFDASLVEIRQRALANKRSIGADTLKGWRWDRVLSARRRSVSTSSCTTDSTAEVPWL